MPVLIRNMVVAEEAKLSKPRNQFNKKYKLQRPINSRASNSTILSPFTPNKKNVAGFKVLGCKSVAAEQVSVPTVIRSSADCEGKKMKKKKSSQKKKNQIVKSINCNENHGFGNNNGSSSCMVIQDVWCGPGIGFSSDAIVGSVDSLVSKRNFTSTRKIDGDDRTLTRDKEREGPCVGRRAGVKNIGTEPAFVPSWTEAESFETRYYQRVRDPSPDGLAEIMFMHNSFVVMGGRSDRFSNWRLDIDHMSYEQLLELGDRIGYVCTGLKEDEISRFVRKIRVSIHDVLPSQSPMSDKKCSICQEEYEMEDELGKLECGHVFHILCIKQWLVQKNACPVCKKAPAPRG